MPGWKLIHEIISNLEGGWQVDAGGPQISGHFVGLASGPNSMRLFFIARGEKLDPRMEHICPPLGWLRVDGRLPSNNEEHSSGLLSAKLSIELLESLTAEEMANEIKVRLLPIYRDFLASLEKHKQQSQPCETHPLESVEAPGQETQQSDSQTCHDSWPEIEDEEVRSYEQVRTKLRSIASKPEIAKLMAQFGMAKDPFGKTNSLAEDPIRVPTTLYEHFGFLLRSGVPEKITLRVLSRPKWFRRSLELRIDGASKKEIFWTLTDQGRLIISGSSVYGKTIHWVRNKIVDLFKESFLSNKIWSGITALTLVFFSLNRFERLWWHGEHFLFNSLMVIIGFFGANGFAYNLYPERMFDEKAQVTIASGLLFFFVLWFLISLGYGFLAGIRLIANY